MTVRDTDIPANDNPLSRNLLEMYEVLSNKIAGGQRIDHRDLLPGVDDPNEGLIPDEFLPSVVSYDWFDPVDWAGLDASSVPRLDLAAIPAPGGKVTPGKGLDFFRSGEAPNNYANRNNPLYQARRQFAMEVAPRIEEMFGVSASGSAGYMRAPSAGDAAPGGRSANSDHYSGGAIDFFGTVDEMVALRNWAETQPWVSFVRCQSESHYDHVHLSIDVGWIAQNYFQGRETPTLPTPQRRVTAPRTPGEPELAPAGPTAAPPTITPGRPS